MSKAPKPKHLYGAEAFKTECGLHTMRVNSVHTPERATCEDCKRLRQERHAAKMASDTAYRRHHELTEAFAAMGVKSYSHAPIGFSLSDAEKVLRKLQRLQRLEEKVAAGGDHG